MIHITRRPSDEHNIDTPSRRPRGGDARAHRLLSCAFRSRRRCALRCALQRIRRTHGAPGVRGAPSGERPTILTPGRVADRGQRRASAGRRPAWRSEASTLGRGTGEMAGQGSGAARPGLVP
ncbi:hypothetical protein KC19_8G068500 [Ceratodon purpureus]|uniref:Uncharacterized protein n=1 Tax=Ceratodon purpureus TaxID=3225 RepID=A0A8T0GW59_CERPU|nr:hypothetical protein KC19_8G068500 [Ceratodon purpureus]